MAVLKIEEFNNSKNKITFYINELDRISSNIKKSILKIDDCYNTNNKTSMEKLDLLLNNNIEKMKDNYKDYIYVMNKNSDIYTRTELEVSESFENIGNR